MNTEQFAVEQALRAQRDKLLTELRRINNALNHGDEVLIMPGGEHHSLIREAIEMTELKREEK